MAAAIVPPTLQGRRIAVLGGVLVLASGLAFLSPAGFRLPALSIFVLAAAGIVSAYAWWRGRNGDAGWWDVAGLLTFVGFSAALIADPEVALPALESQSQRR